VKNHQKATLLYFSGENSFFFKKELPIFVLFLFFWGWSPQVCLLATVLITPVQKYHQLKICLGMLCHCLATTKLGGKKNC
jgi:hypothetical protein